jgi:hypothetical protein
MRLLRLDRIGPGTFLRGYKDEWLATRQAAKLFFLSAILLLALTPVFLGWIDTAKMTFWMRLPWGILGVLGPIALFFLWLGMWRYWLRIDDSRAWVKRIWFLILLIGFCWGSFLYYFSVCLPQTIRRRGSVEA